MKKKFFSLACALTLMLTVFAVPTNAAENLIEYDTRTLAYNRDTYSYTLGVVTSAAATTGESPLGGLAEMTCSMYIQTASGVYPDSDSSPIYLEVAISGHGEIISAQSRCGILGYSGSVVLDV